MATARRIAIALALLAAVCATWAAGNAWVVRRLVLDPAWPAPAGEALVRVVVALAVLPFLQPLVERVVGPRRARWLAWPGYAWMGLCLLLVVGLVATDGLLAISGAARPPGTAPAASAATATRAQAFAVVLGALSAGALALANVRRGPAIRRVEIALERWPGALDGFRIAQISDLHVGAMLGRDFAADVTRRVNALDADLVAVTGDLVDGTVAHLAEEVAPLGGLRARHGVFFVTGNHDYYSGADAWIDHLRGLGWRVLRNERVTIGDRDDGFDLAGVDDHRAAHHFGGDHGEDLSSALDGRDPARALVLLAHDPSTFRAAARRGVDLQVSGHTHGGQIWPFGLLVRLFVPRVAGRLERGGSLLLVSRGTGYWGPPMRLGAPAEITEIVVRRRGGTGAGGGAGGAAR